MDKLNLQIRRWISEYLGYLIPVREFERRVVSSTWNAERSHDPDTVDLIHEVELSLAEFGNGDRSEDELRVALSPLVTSYSWSEVPRGHHFTSSASFIDRAVDPRTQSADRELVKVSWLAETVNR